MAEQRNVPPLTESSPEQTPGEIDRYNVLVLNDDYTPMEFVVHALERFFSKGREDATRIMLHVHRKGVGICGLIPGRTPRPKLRKSWSFRASTNILCNA